MGHVARDIIFDKAKRIKLLILDVDGVLTDGSITYAASGEQIQSFNVKDGLGIALLKKAGIEVAIISSRSSGALQKRAAELGIKEIAQGIKNKLSSYEELKSRMGLSDDEIAYMGDDWVDLPLMKRVGLGITVADAWEPMQDYAHYITMNPGGRGAVREVCDLILKAQNKWSAFLNDYLNP